MDKTEAVRKLQALFSDIEVEWSGERRSWVEHITRQGARGYADEVRLVQPRVFPAFAKAFLDFEVGLDLGAEQANLAGIPDFTPADRVTHRFVFETKGSDEGLQLSGHDEQVEKYLRHDFTTEVVLTNCVGLRVMRMNAAGVVVEVPELAVDLRSLATVSEDVAIELPDAERFVEFIQRFKRRRLTTSEKIDRVCEAPAWNPLLEITDADWMRARIQRVVETLRADVADQIAAGALLDPAGITDAEQSAILDELRLLSIRLQVTPERASELSLADFLDASASSNESKAVAQYQAHVAYWLVTKLVLTRIWEDLGLLEPANLYDGGFEERMQALDGEVLEVIRFAFGRAEHRYKALFVDRPTYSWFRPSHEVAVDAVYELATTYFGEVHSDVLGEVYERTLQRIDRKLLGQYYTPRDIIRLIWDLALSEELVASADEEGRGLRVLDIAAGSGGFLVEGIARLRSRYEAQLEAGSQLDRQSWINQTVDGFNGVELQRFSAFLAELNLLIQFSKTLAADKTLKLPELGVIPADTLSLHDPENLIDGEAQLVDSEYFDVHERVARARRIKTTAAAPGSLFDVAIGNPPYIGETIGAVLWKQTRERYPYWSAFAAPHVDYLYPFLILGVSKLRRGGRFGFITTEYWLRAVGAAPLRKYLAERCQIERIILFREMRLFPDAPGQHSLVVVGQRTVDESEAGGVTASFPRVSIYEGPNLPVADRPGLLEVLREGSKSTTNRVDAFTSVVSPQEQGANSWSEVVLPKEEVTRRQRVRALPQMGGLDVTEGVITTMNRMPASGAEAHLTQPILNELDWPSTKAGVFTLTPDEVSALGSLSEVERAALRRLINTVDVLPYAAIVPGDAAFLIYLPKPAESEAATSVDAAQNLPFPSGMPRLEQHLQRFKPLLLAKLGKWTERRPWWSLHRAREAVVGTTPDGPWADYCVTTRWGSGSSLIVGLAPAGAVPSSSLHALRVAGSDHTAAYLSGLFNSTMFQDMSKSLPPGHVRAEELQALGLPDLGPAKRDAVAAQAIAQAETVTLMVSTYEAAFPKLRETLRSDVSLGAAPVDTWLPTKVTTGPTWGTFGTTSWVQAAAPSGPQNQRFDDAEIEESLLGRVVSAVRRDATRTASVSFHLPHESTDAEVRALAAYLRGLGCSGVRLNQLNGQPLPLEPAALDDIYSADVAGLEEVVDLYRAQRAAIDDLLESE